MPREAYIYRLVLEYLEKCSTEKGQERKSTHEIAKATSVPYSTIARVIRQLSKEKRVFKYHGHGNSFLYKFRTYDLPVGEKGSNLSIPSNKPSVDPIESKMLRNIIQSWIQSGWRPAAIESAETLVTMLSKIHQYYWAAIEHGVAVDQSDLDFCKTKLTIARENAHNFAEFFDRLLATTDLWDARKSAEYMLSDLDNPVDYVETARNVSEVLK